MKTKSMKINEEYKQQKRIEKERLKREKMIEKRRLLLNKKRTEAIEKAKVHISSKYEKQLLKYKKQQEIMLEKQKRKIKWKKPLKKHQKKIKWKQKAFSEIQKYSKLSRSNNKWYVLQVDTWKVVKWNKCQWWHMYPKKNYPQLAFDINNIRPISPRWNKKQADNIADWIDNTPLKEKTKEKLKRKSKDKELKNKVKSSVDYMELYEKYRKLNDKEEKRLWIRQ